MASTTALVPGIWRKAQNWTTKTTWGIRMVGVTAAMRGAFRTGRLYLRRPKRGELKLQSGPILEFGFPNQVPFVLLVFGDFIDPEFAFLRKVCRPGSVVADVGAAIGQFAIFAAVSADCFVHAFEPCAANVEALSRNIQRNRVGDKVTVHRIAFSDVEAEAYFETAPNTWVSGLSETGGELVSVRRLDDEFERMGVDHVAVLKINVAGFEPSVLQGAESFLARGGADILILLLGLASLPWYARLSDYGYRFFYFQPDENALYEVTSFDARSVLGHRPSPARNIIAIHHQVIGQYLGTQIPIRRVGADVAGR
jgi:FkbM family methyltransferase